MIQKRDWEQAELQRQFCEAREGSLVCTISPSTRKNPLPASGALFSCPFKEKKKIKEPQLILESVGQSFYFP